MRKTKHWLLVAANSSDDAVRNARQCLEDWQAREGYDGWEALSACPAGEVPKEAREKERQRYQDAMSEHAGEIALAGFRKYPQGSAQLLARVHQGRYMVKLGKLLMEDFSPDMPWFNCCDWDYTWNDGMWAVLAELWW